jgi:predicted phage-related endonuclease
MTITPEQIAFRKGKIGASQFGQAVGRGYGKRTRAELYHSIQGTVPQMGDSMAARVGNFMEGFILKEYTLKTGRDAHDFPATQIHPDEPRIICHCDGITTDKTRLIEVKNVGPHMKSAWIDGPPQYVWVQACGQSMLTGIKAVDVVAYFGGNDLEVYELSFTDIDHSTLFDGLMDFLGYLDSNEPPPNTVLDLHNLDLYYTCKDTAIAADNDREAQAVLLASLKKKYKLTAEDKETMELLEFNVKEYMGENSVLTSESGTPLFTWKQSKDKVVTDWEAVTNALYAAMAVATKGMEGVDDNYVKHLFDLSVASNTTTKKGSRTFLCKIKEA